MAHMGSTTTIATKAVKAESGSEAEAERWMEDWWRRDASASTTTRVDTGRVRYLLSRRGSQVLWPYLVQPPTGPALRRVRHSERHEAELRAGLRSLSLLRDAARLRHNSDETCNVNSFNSRLDNLAQLVVSNHRYNTMTCPPVDNAALRWRGSMTSYESASS